MMLWIVVGAEALLILLIFIKMLSKRRSFSGDEDDQPSKPDLSLLTETLSSAERWEDGDSQAPSEGTKAAAAHKPSGANPDIAPRLPEQENSD